MENVVDNADALLNPEVSTMSIGVRESEEIMVYPLSYFDQKNIGMAVLEYFNANQDLLQKGNDFDFVGSLFVILEEKLPLLLDKCIDMPSKKFMKNVTAGQIMEFITIVMEVNFLNPIQKGARLIGDMGSMFAGSPLSQPSVSGTDINLATSENPTKTGD